MTRSHPLNPRLDLERGCIRPGLWRIEGYHVESRVDHGWHLSSRTGRQYWGSQIVWAVREQEGGPLLVQGSTLRECEEWIADQLEQRRSDTGYLA